MTILIASLSKSVVSLDRKVTLFTTRLREARAESITNTSTLASGLSLAAEDPLVKAMVTEGYEALERALKLKIAKLETSVAEVTEERDNLRNEIAKLQAEQDEAAA